MFSFQASIEEGRKERPVLAEWQGNFGDQSIPQDVARKNALYQNDTSYKRVALRSIKDPQDVSTPRVGVEDQYFVAMFLLPDTPTGVRSQAGVHRRRRQGRSYISRFCGCPGVASPYASISDRSSGTGSARPTPNLRRRWTMATSSSSRSRWLPPAVDSPLYRQFRLVHHSPHDCSESRTVPPAFEAAGFDAEDAEDSTANAPAAGSIQKA